MSSLNSCARSKYTSTSLLLPVIVKLGIDPVHYVMIMILNLGIGLTTPPVGPTPFVGCAVGKVSRRFRCGFRG